MADQSELVQDYSQRLAWYQQAKFGLFIHWGAGADTRSVLNQGIPEQVKDHVRLIIEVLASGGGFIFNTIHNILPDVPPENVVAMFEAVDEYQ
jgi:uroporphyrinogen decarboxylase